MLRIFEIKLPLNHNADDLPCAIARNLRIPLGDIESWKIRRQAIDARNKNSIRLIYTVDVLIRHEEKLLKKKFSRRVLPAPDETYKPVAPGKEKLKNRPVIIGSGPAGLFAGLVLAQAGFAPLILERGKSVEERSKDVERFWQEGILNPQSNAQFGEGGAGTFSDGKLTTQINDVRCRKVLDELVLAGAPQSILVSGKPHVGTDALQNIVRALREAIIRCGGDIRFNHQVTDLRIHDHKITALQINGSDIIESQVVVLAIGHSARDTFVMLHERGITMTPKPFSIGVRIEHPQKFIDETQYGACAGHARLGAADYKMAYHAQGGRSAYTFCMCPGGQVIAASSEPEGVVVNGMSRRARDGGNGNAALLVNVSPADFAGDHPLAGFTFQRKWEAAAFKLGHKNYTAPMQLLGDFMHARASDRVGSVEPTYRPGIVPTDLRGCLPDYVCTTLKQAIPAFARQLQGFDLPDAILTGVETRSSCPVRVVREETLESNICGLYPTGEGAGYAGGIISAAVDGIRVAEAVITRFACP